MHVSCPRYAWRAGPSPCCVQNRIGAHGTDCREEAQYVSAYSIGAKRRTRETMGVRSLRGRGFSFVSRSCSFCEPTRRNQNGSRRFSSRQGAGEFDGAPGLRYEAGIGLQYRPLRLETPRSFQQLLRLARLRFLGSGRWGREASPIPGIRRIIPTSSYSVVPHERSWCPLTDPSDFLRG